MTTQPVGTTYETADLALVTALSLWLPIDSIDRSNPKQAVFNFTRTDELERLLEMYWRKDLLIEPQGYFNQLRSIKARLYERI
jgi:hypothetical protein